MFEFARIGVVQGVLKLGLVQPRADRDILRGLHVKRDPLDLGEVGPQPRYYLIDRVTLIRGLELNVGAAVVKRIDAAARTDRRADRVDRRILHQGILAEPAGARNMAWKEISCAASDWAIINPVSCWGKKPLGMIT